MYVQTYGLRRVGTDGLMEVRDIAFGGRDQLDRLPVYPEHVSQILADEQQHLAQRGTCRGLGRLPPEQGGQLLPGMGAGLECEVGEQGQAFDARRRVPGSGARKRERGRPQELEGGRDCLVEVGAAAECFKVPPGLGAASAGRDDY